MIRVSEEEWKRIVDKLRRLGERLAQLTKEENPSRRDKHG